MRLNKILADISVMAGVALSAASPACAQARLAQSSPIPDSAISAPKSIKLTFSEKISPAFSGFQISMGDGMTISAVTKISDDGKTILGTPTSSFMAGQYTLTWHATALDDGHHTEGSYSFTVK